MMERRPSREVLMNAAAYVMKHQIANHGLESRAGQHSTMRENVGYGLQSLHKFSVNIVTVAS